MGPGRRLWNRRPGWRPATGFTLIELLFALGLLLLLTAMALPPVLTGIDRSRARAAARFLAARLALARSQAVARSATVALRFSPAASDVVVVAYVDGNGNGVRSAEIASGEDVALEAPVSLAHLFPGVTVGSIALGSSGILSFSPAGTATSGTIYIRGRDGTQYAVRVFGVTGRTRVLRYDPVARAFVETF